MTIYINSRNSKRYQLTTSAIPSFCNGQFSKFEEIAADVPVPKQPSWSGTPSKVEKANIKELRAAAVASLSPCGFHVMSYSSARLLDLITGALSDVFDVHQVSLDGVPLVAACGRKKKINVSGIAEMIKTVRAPTKLKTGVKVVPMRDDRYRNGGYKTTIETVHDLMCTVVNDTEHPVNFFDAQHPALKGTKLFKAKSSLSSNLIASYDYYRLSIFDAAQVPELSTGTSFGLNCSINYVCTNDNPLRDAYCSGQGGRQPVLLANTTERQNTLMYSTLVRRMLDDGSGNQLLMLTDNTKWGSYNDATGAKIRHFLSLQHKGIQQVEACDGTPLYFAVVPQYVGNPNHSDHNTVMMFLGLKPVVITNITKTKRIKT